LTINGKNYLNARRRSYRWTLAEKQIYFEHMAPLKLRPYGAIQMCILLLLLLLWT